MEDTAQGNDGPSQLKFENVSPATRLLEKRRQMYEVQDALAQKKANFLEEDKHFQKEERALREKDSYLQKQLIRFNKFLQDNEAKRKRAETRAAEEKAQIHIKEQEIADLDAQLDECQSQCGVLEESVKRNMRYEEFLETVKDACEEYTELQDLIARYDTLQGANEDLQKHQKSADVRLEDLRGKAQGRSKQRQLKILELTTEIAQSQKVLEAAEVELNTLEQHVDVLTTEESEQSLYLGMVLHSVDNLFQRCIEKRPAIQHRNEFEGIHGSSSGSGAGKKKVGGKDEEEEDDESDEHTLRKRSDTCTKQLRVVGNYIKDFNDMLEIIKKNPQAQRNLKTKDDANLDVEPTAEILTTMREFHHRSHGDDGNTMTKSRFLGAGQTTGMFDAGQSTRFGHQTTGHLSADQSTKFGNQPSTFIGGKQRTKGM